MNKPLLYDLSRCYGVSCAKKDRCQRYLTIVIDTPGLYAYSSNKCGRSDDGVPECGAFIEAIRGSNESE